MPAAPPALAPPRLDWEAAAVARREAATAASSRAARAAAAASRDGPALDAAATAARARAAAAAAAVPAHAADGWAFADGGGPLGRPTSLAQLALAAAAAALRPGAPRPRGARLHAAHERLVVQAGAGGGAVTLASALLLAPGLAAALWAAVRAALEAAACRRRAQAAARLAMLAAAAAAAAEAAAAAARGAPRWRVPQRALVAAPRLLFLVDAGVVPGKEIVVAEEGGAGVTASAAVAALRAPAAAAEAAAAAADAAAADEARRSLAHDEDEGLGAPPVDARLRAWGDSVGGEPPAAARRPLHHLAAARDAAWGLFPSVPLLARTDDLARPPGGTRTLAAGAGALISTPPGPAPLGAPSPHLRPGMLMSPGRASAAGLPPAPGLPSPARPGDASAPPALAPGRRAAALAPVVATPARERRGRPAAREVAARALAARAVADLPALPRQPHAWWRRVPPRSTVAIVPRARARRAGLASPPPRRRRAGGRDHSPPLAGPPSDDGPPSPTAPLSFTDRRPKAVAVGRGLHGRGLYALEPVSAGDFVLEYLGELLRAPLADVRERAYGFADGGTYLFRADAQSVVDATQAGGPARFINHSCAPNTATRVTHDGVGGAPRVNVVALVDVAPGDEVTYDYQFAEEGDPIKCNCGAAGCRGTLN